MVAFLTFILLWSTLITVCTQNFLTVRGIECFKCNSKDNANCAIDPTVNLPHFNCTNSEDRCITAIVDGVTVRGCERELKIPTYELWDKCNTSLCNNNLFPKNRFKCYQCKGKQCAKFSDFKTTLKACLNYDPDDFCITDVIDENNVIRSCYSDKVSQGEFPSYCVASGCNVHPAVSELKCASCSQTNATFCVRKTKPTDFGDLCTIPEEETCSVRVLHNRPISCFTYNKPNQVVRGCTKNAGKLASDTEFFKTCEGHMCNNRCLPIKCIKCDSSTNPKCAYQATELVPELCSGREYCHVGEKLGSDLEKVIVRGCGGEDEPYTDFYCFEDGCNNAKYVSPPDLEKNMHCYQCNNEKECKDVLDRLRITPCKSIDDACFQYLNNQNEMVRGCSSDREYLECLAQGDKCYQCSYRGCNNRPKVRKAFTSCHSCNETHKNCLWKLKKGDVPECHPEALYYDDFVCYSCLTEALAGKKGCLNPSNKDDLKCNNITTCTADLCNENSILEQSCLQCDGNFQRCDGIIQGTPCNKPLSFDTMGCYTKREGDKFKRGCVSDFEGRQVCVGDESFCHICWNKDCNTSGAAEIFFRLGVIFAPLLGSLFLTI